MTTLRTRAHFAYLCNDLGIVRAVEVGTDRGLFAEEFLHRWKGEILICVDHWAPYKEMPYDRSADMMMAVQLLAPFRTRVKLARGESVKLARPIGGHYRPGFIYIDGDHAADAVRADLRAWWPYLQPGGILAGHDYMPPEYDSVVQAVDAFAAEQGIEVNVTDDLNEYRSWWMVKPS